MAFAAPTHDHQLETLRVRAADRMGAVTFAADRQLFRGGGHLRRVHALLELFLNADVTDSARGGNVVGVDARLEAVRREDAVCGMAARAHRGDNETALDEPLTVDALGIPLYDLELGAGISNRRLLSRAVAACAQGGDVEGKSRRRRIPLSEDVVGAGTLRA